MERLAVSIERLQHVSLALGFEKPYANAIGRRVVYPKQHGLFYHFHSTKHPNGKCDKFDDEFVRVEKGYKRFDEERLHSLLHPGEKTTRVSERAKS